MRYIDSSRSKRCEGESISFRLGVSVKSSTNAANTWLESYNSWQRTAVSTTAHNLLLIKPINFYYTDDCVVRHG